MSRSVRWLLLVLSAAAVVFVAVQAVRPEPGQAVTAGASVKTTAVPGIAWPQAREAAVSVEGIGSIQVHGRQVPVPTASLAKIMTAYLVLRAYPLAGSAAGPDIVITQAQAAAYEPDLAASESVVKVRAGESLTERQALEALLPRQPTTWPASLPSGTRAVFPRS